MGQGLGAQLRTSPFAEGTVSLLSVALHGGGPAFRVSAPASGAPAGRLGPRVQMGNCMPNHPFRHPLICFPHANMGFLQMDIIYLLLPHFI